MFFFAMYSQIPSYFKTRVIKHLFQRYGWTKTLPMAEEMKLKFSKGSRLPVCQFPNKKLSALHSEALKLQKAQACH